jgi:acyl dehydratase
MMIDACVRDGIDETPVSLGYDGIRFLGPVFFGDTITVVYTIETIDPARRRTTADIKITNQRGELVTVAKHILKWVKNPKAT